MRYTVPIVAEKALDLLGVKPLYANFAPEAGVQGFSTATRERRRTDILWLNDNSGGSRPYAACGARHCVHIASRAEEAGGLPECEADRSLVVLPHTVQLRRLVTAMEQCFAFYNAWGDALLDAIRRGDGWAALAREGHRALQNPMILYDRSMRILAYTEDDAARDPLWADTIRGGAPRVDSPALSGDLMRFLAQAERGDAPFSFQGEGMSDPFWCCPVRLGGRTCGMVNVVEVHRPLSLGDRDLLRYFAEHAALAMQRSAGGSPLPDVAPRQFMLDLLGGEITSRERLNSRLIAVDWPTLKHFRFVCLRSGLPYLSGEQWHSLYTRLVALGLNGLASMLDREEPGIGLLLTADAPERFDVAAQIVGEFCAMNRLRAGISDVYDDLLDTPRFYRQAEAALELSREPLCFYEQARYGRMLRHLRSHPHREDLVHPAALHLARRDREEGTEYLKTLRSLIAHAFNQQETAEDLGIHRTTLAYRLRRVQELTGLDPSDARQMFHIAVSLKLMEDGRE